MLNILIPKTKKITWWSVVKGLEKVCPIIPAKDAPLPSYWKDIPRTKSSDLFDKGTAKACPALPDFWELGYVVPLWSDTLLKFERNEQGGVSYTAKCSDGRFNFTHHGDDQFRDFLPARVQGSVQMVLKANCPWRVKTPDGYSMIQLPMSYHYDPVFEVLSGVIWTDIHHEINQQMVIKECGEFLLRRGHPLAMYVPYRREDFTTEIQGPTPENEQWDMEVRTNLWTKIRGGYRLRQSEAKKRKCPFH